MNFNSTVNFHLLKNCNFRCKFCYAHFNDASLLTFDESKQILIELKKMGVYKINFAGGEPLLYKNFEELLVLAKELSFVTSVISNGSKMTKTWIFEFGKFLDIVGISCDSAKSETLINLGRGNGNSYETTKEVFHNLDLLSFKINRKIFKKLNSVITRLNFQEDMNDFVKSLNIDRWKIFQILRIDGENEKAFKALKISDCEFKEFVSKHLSLNSYRTKVVAETNTDMIDSYLMINPDGSFFQNSKGKYVKSLPILEVGWEKAFNQISFSEKKFLDRGGGYLI